MTIDVIDNRRIYMDNAIRTNLDWAEEFDMAVAYARFSAYSPLERRLIDLLNNGGRMRTIFDIERKVTDRRLIQQISNLPGDNQTKFFYRPLSDRPDDEGDRPSFHPKLYIFRRGNEYRIIIGSSNLTKYGLHENVEFNVEIRGTDSDDVINRIIESFQNIWNDWYSTLVQDHPEVLEVYEEVKNKEEQAIHTQTREQAFKKLVERLDDAANEAKAQQQSSLNREIAYIVGMLSAKGKINVAEHSIGINVSSYRRNPGTPDEGKIVEEGISDINLDQKQAVERDVKNIVDDLNALFAKSKSGDEASYEDVSRTSFTFNITIKFNPASPYWAEIISLTEGSDRLNYFNSPIIPDDIKNASRAIKLSFIRGYFDIRSRISSADRYPGVGRLRIGIQIGTYAEDFARQLIHILQNDFNVNSVQLASGEQRHRDNMLRIDPNDLTTDFFTSFWKKLLLRDFQLYNNELAQNRSH